MQSRWHGVAPPQTVTFSDALANATLGPALLCHYSPSTLLHLSLTCSNLRELQQSTLGRHALAIALPHTMYYERKELIQSLDLLCFVLFVYTWLLDNRTLLLLIKSALQVQFCNPLQLHPTWSLPFFVVFLACLNALLALAHLWAPASATNRGDAILIDFVGQDAAPGRLHMLGIDLSVALVQLLMTIVAFECAKDQAKQDGEQSQLDDTTEREGEERGQGWDVRDEEAALFGLDTDDEARRERTSLTHCIAVVRLRPIVDDIVKRQFLPDAPPAEAQEEPQPQQPPVETGDRPDTSRIRRFSRRPRAAPAAADAGAPPAYAGLGPVSADDSWPPMWLILARNMGPRLPSLPSLPSLRPSVMSRFGRSLTANPPAEYTRVNTEPPER